jgi:hypothetical protein
LQKEAARARQLETRLQELEADRQSVSASASDRPATALTGTPLPREIFAGPGFPTPTTLGRRDHPLPLDGVWFLIGF